MVMHMKNRRRYLRFRTKLRQLRKYAMELSTACPQCEQSHLFQYYRFDADFCPVCNEWFSPACSDPKCPYCANRPDTPAEALFEESNVNRMKKYNLMLNYQHKTNGMNKHRRKRILFDEIKNNSLR